MKKNRIIYWILGGVLVVIALILLVPAMICEFFSEKYNDMVEYFSETVDKFWESR